MAGRGGCEDAPCSCDKTVRPLEIADAESYKMPRICVAKLPAPTLNCEHPHALIDSFGIETGTSHPQTQLPQYRPDRIYGLGGVVILASVDLATATTSRSTPKQLPTGRMEGKSSSSSLQRAANRDARPVLQCQWRVYGGYSPRIPKRAADGHQLWQCMHPLASLDPTKPNSSPS
jgi:hypothetical protein